MAKDYQFIGVIKGPIAYLGEFGCTAEHITLTKEEIEEELEDGETVEDYIDYYLEEYVNEWEQKFCSVQVYTKEQWDFLHFIIGPNK
jgi:hypothetical protein